MLEFKKIDDETYYANDPDRHDIENPRAIIILYDVWAFDAEYSDALLSSSDCRQIADKLDELNGVKKPEIFGELWIDEKGNPNFLCHTKNENFQEVRAALIGFDQLLHQQILNQEKCPFFKKQN